MPAIVPFIVPALISAAISGVTYGIQVALQPTPKKPILSGRIDNLRSIRRDNTAPLRIVYGTARAAGVLLFTRSCDRNGKFKPGGPFLHGALAQAYGPIEDIYDIQLNDKPADSTEFAHLAAFVPFMGFQDQPMFRGPIQLSRPKPVSRIVPEALEPLSLQLPEEWLQAYRPLREIAYLWFTLRHDPEVFRGGAPNIRSTMRGRLVYDPRDNGQHDTDPTTWRWSDNGPLCIRDFLTNPVYGFNIPQSAINDDAISAAADTADEAIDAPSDRLDPDDPMPTIKRYTVNGIFESDEVPLDVLGRMLQVCAASVLVHSGKFHLRVGEPDVTASDISTGRVITLRPHDVRADEPLNAFRLPGKDARINTVRGTYINPNKDYIADEFPAVTAEEFVEEDGNVELVHQMQLDFCNHPDRAQYIGAIYLRKERLARTSWPVTPAKAAQLLPLSRLWLLYPHFGWGFLGTVSVNGGTKTYTGTGIGKGLKIGDVIGILGCAVAGNNGSKTLVTVSDNAISVAETCTTEGPTLDVEVGGKDAQILNWDRLPNGAINLHLREYSHHTWDRYLNPALQPLPTNLPDPFLLLPPRNVRAVEATQINPDGTRVSKIEVTWDQPGDGIVDGFKVSWQRINPTAGTAQSQTISAPASRFDIPNLAIGTYIVVVGSTLNGKVKWAPATDVDVTYRTAAPPVPIDVRVQQLVTGGLRRLTWRFENRPPDLFGTEVRWLPGVVAATEENWAAAKLIRQTRSDVIETSTPTAPGTYTYLLRSIDTTELVSNEIASVQIEIAPSAPDMLLERSFDEEGWPVGDHGHIAGGRINEEGHIEGQGEQLWEEDDDPTWDDVEEFNSGGATVLYTTDVIDILTDRAFVASVRYRVLHADNVLITIRTRREADASWGPWRFVRGGFGRYVQLRIRAYASSTAPTIEMMAAALRASLIDDIRNDLAMTGTLGTLTRVEQRFGDWNSGPWQANCEPRRSGDELAFMRPDPESSLELDGDTYVSAPDHPFTRLQTGALSLEALLRVSVLNHPTCVIVGKGDAWQMLYGNGVFQLVLNGAIVAGSQITIPSAFPIYHVAYSFRFGRLFVLLNGELIRTVDPGPILLNTDTSPLRIGADADGDQRFAGIIEDVRVWRIGRSPEDISRDAGAHVQPDQNGLVAYYRCDDRAGNLVRDRTALINHGTIVGTPTWVRMAYRESPPLPLGLLPRWDSGTAKVLSLTPLGTEVTAQMSTNGTAWVNIGLLSTPVPNMTAGEDPGAKLLRMRQFLKTTDLDKNPEVHSIQVALKYRRALGDLVVQPGLRFSELVQARVDALQNAPQPATAHLVLRDRAGVRFRVVDARTGARQDALVDVTLRGVPLEV